jgi:hypothetical protein
MNEYCHLRERWHEIIVQEKEIDKFYISLLVGILGIIPIVIGIVFYTSSETLFWRLFVSLSLIILSSSIGLLNCFMWKKSHLEKGRELLVISQMILELTRGPNTHSKEVFLREKKGLYPFNYVNEGMGIYTLPDVIARLIKGHLIVFLLAWLLLVFYIIWQVSVCS